MIRCNQQLMTVYIYDWMYVTVWLKCKMFVVLCVFKASPGPETHGSSLIITAPATSISAAPQEISLIHYSAGGVR